MRGIGGILGIHHVTAIASGPQRNHDFYTGVLGLRLVKTTVNFDDPGTYHFYYGDELGRPGTIMTFFPWPDAPRGHRGVGQMTVTSFAVPPGTLDAWTRRLEAAGVEITGRRERFGEEVLSLDDPDGLRLELVEVSEKSDLPSWDGAGVPPGEAIRGFAGAALAERDVGATARLLEAMEMTLVGEAEGRTRFTVGTGAERAHLDVVARPDGVPGRAAAGIIHHIAFRVSGDESELAWRERLLGLGFHVTEVRDRQYFRSIYFREPGGVLFELATDPPGFTHDETPAELGTVLKLPPGLEKDRSRIEEILPELRRQS